jgi:tetratricopeptide (TPR) repeat protein
MRRLALIVVATLLGAVNAAAQPAQVTCREGAPEVAIAACTTVLNGKGIAPELRVLTLINRGTAYAKSRDLDSALVDFDAAIKLDPKSAAAHNYRGLVMRERGDYDLAIESYTTAIKLQPQVAAFHINRGIAYRWRLDYDNALADLNDGLKINPKAWFGLSERGLVYRRKQDFQRAIADHDEAVRLAPKAWKAYSYRAFTHETRNDLKSALADFKMAQALAANVDSARAADMARSVSRIENKIAGLGTQPPAARPGSPAPNASAPRNAGQRVALVIGNSRYSNVAQLINPKNDAEVLSKALRAVGFNNVMLKTDLTREQLNTALKEFAEIADKAEWAVIYYAGHGIEVGGNNYLVPVDAKFTSDRDVSFEAVTLDQALQSVEGASKLRLVILDACRDNPFIARMKKSSGTRSVGKGLANIEPEGATLVAYAAKHGQTAEDGNTGNSPFAMALVKQIQTPGLEINLVFRKVRDDVLAATGKRQEPFTYGSLPSEAFYFKAN